MADQKKEEKEGGTLSAEARKAQRRKLGRLSKEEHRGDALALRAEERRDKLRKAAGRSKYPSIRGCLNGETRLRKPQAPLSESIV